MSFKLPLFAYQCGRWQPSSLDDWPAVIHTEQGWGPRVRQRSHGARRGANLWAVRTLLHLPLAC